VGQDEVYGFVISPDADGNWTSQTDRSYTIGKNGFEDGNPDAAWYFESILMGKTGWIEPYKTGEGENRHTVLSCVLPVIKDDIVLGTLRADFSPDFISDYLRTIDAKDGSFAFVLSRNGQIMGHPSLDGKTGELPAHDAALVNSLAKGFSETDKEVVALSGDYFLCYDIIQDGMRVGYAVPRSVIMSPVWAMIYRLLAGALAALAVASLLGVTFGKSLGRGDLREVSFQAGSAEEVAALQEAVSRTISNLRDMMGEVRNLAEQLAASAEEVAAGAEESGQGAENSMTQVQKVAEVISQQRANIASLSRLIIEGGESVQGSMERMQILEKSHAVQEETTHEGVRLVGQTQTSVESLRDISESVNTSFREVTESMGKIIGMADTISTIADQTNLLALNAAIEAARAGDAGRGFAVVAEEVRKLAEESAEAAHQIHGYIGEIRPRVDRAETSLSEALTLSEEGAHIVEQTRQAFDAIQSAAGNARQEGTDVAQALDDLTGIYDKIKGELEDINKGRNLIGESLDNLSSVSEEQSAQAEEFAASSQSLSEMAEKLTEQLGKFQTS
jgi:methyl-accepting chemotaxis protein